MNIFLVFFPIFIVYASSFSFSPSHFCIGLIQKVKWQIKICTCHTLYQKFQADFIFILGNQLKQKVRSLKYMPYVTTVSLLHSL